MRQVLSIALGCVFAHASAFGQSAESPTFEVASVRPSPVPAPNERVFFGPARGGPGTHDPERIAWTRAALRNILMTAYDVQTFQIIAPDWLSTARYDIAANVPAGAAKEQVTVMWQNLLKDRFGLALHHESKEFQVDELTVAKGGLKLKDTDLGPNPDPFAPADGPPKFDKNGAPEMNGFGAIVTIFADGPRARMTAKGLTLQDLAVRLGQQLRHPVIDKTGLAGRYDFTLEYVPDLSGMQLPPPPPGAAGPPPSAAASAVGASDPGSTLAAAVEKQLGLKLSRTKAQLDVIVVDHAEKTPTRN
jgi:bla regulator protein blaR1